MVAIYKRYKEKIELAPSDWLSWKDEDFNNWRRQHDFPRIVEFLFDSLPYFSLWLSEQGGLSEKDLLFHGPSRFIRFYGQPVTYVEHDIGVSIFKGTPARKVLSYGFFVNDDIKKLDPLRVLKKVKFTSYIDWAFSRKGWIFPKKIKDVRDVVRCFTPSGRNSETSDYLDSHSSIQFNIPLFMPNISVESLESMPVVEAPPRLELLKLGGGGIEVVDGLVGEKNLEFTNIDNLTLVSPVVTSFQNIAFSTLRNFQVVGLIHAAKFHQCSVEIIVKDGGLSCCEFEYCDQKVELCNSKFDRSTIRSRQLGLKLSDTEVLDCCFEYSELFYFSSKNEELFHKSAKMIFSHLGYPDLAGEHFLIEKKSGRKQRWERFSSLELGIGIKNRIYALLGFFWMYLQELYWGYGERPFYIILFSIVIIFIASLFGFFEQGSSTYGDIGKSIIFSFQSYTNVSILEIKQDSDKINIFGAVMSFFGLMSIGLLIAALSSKTKNYN